jgi:hypothetical protein
MFRYIISFFKFWRKFIFGDDPAVALVVIWSLLGLYSLSLRGVQAWYIVPIVAGLLLAITFAHTLSTNGKDNKYLKLASGSTYSFKFVHILWSLMLITAIIPYAIFFTENGLYNFSFGNIILPEVLSCLAIIILGFIFSLIKKRRTGASILAALSSLIITKVLYHHQITMASNFNFHDESIFSHTVAYGCR